MSAEKGFAHVHSSDCIMIRWPRIPVLLAALILPVAALAEGRVALLVGNSDYARPELDLANPVNDVRALAEALRGNGFNVIEATDLDAAGMRLALATFSSQAKGAELALFFYAGHGVQFGGDNLLVGVDFEGADAVAVQSASMTMQEVRDAMITAAPQAGFILLDACRDSPFLDNGTGRPGLVRTSGGAGLLIAYSTDPGNVAYDGDGANSVFTTALLGHINTPGLDVRLMLGRVRQEVVLETFAQQVPWVEEALIGEHVISTTPPPAPQDDAVADEVRLWRQVFADPDPAAMQTYLSAYPDGMFAEIARERLAVPDGRAPDAALISAATTDLAGQDPARLGAALTVLGLPVPPSGDGMADAVARYLAERPTLDGTTLDPLYEEATRNAMILAAATAQRMRTDLVALRSVDRVLRVSQGALTEIAAIAADNPDALPVLQQAQSDVDDIITSRDRILNRLDQSRGYYQDILDETAAFLPPDATVALIASAGSGGVGIDQRVRDDAAMFLNHVRESDPDKKGSYAWLADFLQQS